jgi:dTMP kinase
MTLTSLNEHAAAASGQHCAQGLMLPAAPPNSPGRIIAIEGTDGVGRSTQVQLLREWLEIRGYGVVETGLTHSRLMETTIELAKSSNTLNPLTFVLLYACDFADRMEKEILPALSAGFIVLADRYIYTAIARACVRGVDSQWLRRLYGFAIAPHIVFYLNIDTNTLVRRVLNNGGISYWESGMDMRFGDDIFDNFRGYQRRLLRAYSSMAKEFGFHVLDGRLPVDMIQEELRRQVGLFLDEKPTTVESELQSCG